MGSELVATCTCPCTPGKIFANGLYQHKKTKKHLAWEEKDKHQAATEKRMENELFSLRLKVDRLQRENDIIQIKHKTELAKLSQENNELIKLIENLHTQLPKKHTNHNHDIEANNNLYL